MFNGEKNGYAKNTLQNTVTLEESEIKKGNIAFFEPFSYAGNESTKRKNIII